MSDYLYHYTSIETLLLYILPEKRLRFSSIKTTNDPEECYDHNVFHGDMSLEQLNDFSHIIKNQARIVSLTQDGDYKGYEKPRMWAQYSNHHRGACLIFNRRALIKEFRHAFKDTIHYDDKISYDITDERIARTKEAFTIHQDTNIDQHIRKYIDIFYFCKHPDWRQENEYRLFVRSADNCFINLDGILEAIVLGVEAEPHLNKPISLVSAVFEHKPKIYKLDYIDNRYLLNEI